MLPYSIVFYIPSKQYEAISRLKERLIFKYGVLLISETKACWLSKGNKHKEGKLTVLEINIKGSTKDILEVRNIFKEECRKANMPRCSYKINNDLHTISLDNKP